MLKDPVAREKRVSNHYRRICYVYRSNLKNCLPHPDQRIGKFPSIFRKWLNRGNSFFHWFNRDATLMRADIACGRRPIEYFSIVAAYFRGGRAERAYFNNDIRVLCGVRNWNYCSRDEIWSLCAANLRGFCESIHGFHQPPLYYELSQPLIPYFSQKLDPIQNPSLPSLLNFKFSIFCESY